MWAFAIINNRLAEVFFEKKRNKLFFNGYCYVNRRDYHAKQEKRWIEADTKKHRFTYRNKGYIDQRTKQKIPRAPFTRA